MSLASMDTGTQVYISTHTWINIDLSGNVDLVGSKSLCKSEECDSRILFGKSYNISVAFKAMKLDEIKL